MAVSIDKFSRTFKTKVKKVLKDIESTGAMQEVGDSIIKDVQTRTRKGYGATSQHNKIKLDKLSDSYKKQRKKMRLSSTTRPNKSNLTQSGEMLESLERNKIRGGVRVIPSGLDNKKKAKWVSKKRPFLNMTKPEIKRARKVLSNILDRIVKKIF